jgi:NAD(P)-dependent dehydrogenase (short-subunit alcohol dehydrogenase family)
MRTFNFQPDRDIPSLAGKVIVITGGTSGLGAESVLSLAKHSPARIYFTGRNDAAAQAVIERVRHALDKSAGSESEQQCAPKIKSTSTSSVPDLVFLPCDLADLSSVNTLATRILGSEAQIDILMCNAGICAVSPGQTRDGYEIQFGTNHLGHALLTLKLLPLLQKAVSEKGDARIVSLTSFGYNAASGISFDALKTKSGRDWTGMGRWIRYGESKLANILYAKELARRYPGITSVTVHPGVSATALVENMGFLDRLTTKALGIVEGGVLSPEQGSLNQLWAATASKDIIMNGALFDPVGVKVKRLSKAAKDERLAQILWEWTDKELQKWL